MEKISGIFVELSFLDASLNFGQSIFAFAVFGLDSELIVLPFVKRYAIFYSLNKLLILFAQVAQVLVWIRGAAIGAVE